jgi:hypothetical protein
MKSSRNHQERISPTIVLSIKAVAYLLRDGMITPRNAALALLLICAGSERKIISENKN